MIAGAAFGDPLSVTVTFDGAGGAGVQDSNGDYVTPYEVTIDNGSGPVMQLVTCYDNNNDVYPGEPSWQAYEYSIQDITTGGLGMFHGYTATINGQTSDATIGPYNSNIGYEAIGWLSAQLYSDPAHEIALQYAIWDVFGTTQALTGDELSAYNTYEGELQAAADSGFTGFDFSTTKYLESYNPPSNPTSQATPQPFVFAINPNNNNQFGTPEPGTLVMIGSGMLCLLCSFGFKRFAKRG